MAGTTMAGTTMAGTTMAGTTMSTTTMAGTTMAGTTMSTTTMAATIMAATTMTITHYHDYHYHSYCRNVAPAHPSHRVLQPPDFVLYLGPGPGEVLENQSVRSTHHIPDILTATTTMAITIYYSNSLLSYGSYDSASHDSASHGSASHGSARMMTRIATYTSKYRNPNGISHTYTIPWYDTTDIPYRGISRQDPEPIPEKWNGIRPYPYHTRIRYGIT
ncbi:hypothetical protein HO173_005998 [Letharia columbiana]|uniref:Uncharacterized protein n=1 Tax=Letharia columbiana TaxID=112416 RepID=A0A8H6L527_9LECA|nr:uncharacterized protein HO173_005998 [Letharia columbiana]KAF6235803.1 hypothetical protein HO173_005998 [Letharia columbiana]